MSLSSHRTMESRTPLNQRIDIPIKRLSNNTNSKFIEQYTQIPVYSKDTTVQWINDSISGREKFRMKINIEGFHQNEVRIRVDGNKLFVYGERIENKSQGTSKKIIEKFYDLPPDVDKLSPHVTFPSPVTMQVEFPSKYLPIQSHEYISSRKLNGSNIYDRKVLGDPRMYSPDDAIFHENRNSAIPIHRITINSKDSPLIPASLNTQTNKFRESIVDPIIDKNGTIYQQIATKLHRQRSNPTVGSIQSSYNIDHQRSASPALSKIIEEDRISSSSSSTTDSAVSNNESSFLPRDFNSDIFYQSVFKPELFTDDRNQRYIEMKLDVHDYNPDEIQVSMNDNDLIVQVERTNFYKQITLPSNIDATSLSLHHHDKKLHIKVKLLDEYSSFKYI